ncbi:hypothetical protein ACMHYJ_02740 [Castellaniella hirudinis]|uniref:hypothetical protein n=1 Tax=Castellaniella hirudinis TaxID=1144617 RepID=UPI0039C3A784
MMQIKAIFSSICPLLAVPDWHAAGQAQAIAQYPTLVIASHNTNDMFVSVPAISHTFQSPPSL